MACAAGGKLQAEQTEALDDVAFRRLIRRMEQGPPEVTRLILQELHNQSELKSLRALMLAGPNVYSQLSPFIHANLDIDLMRNTEQHIRGLLTVKWLKYVQTLSLFDTRETFPNLPQSLYSAVIEVLLKLSNLRGARIYLHRSCQAANALVLDILSAAPLLLHLDYMEMGSPDSDVGSIPEDAGVVLYKRASAGRSFQNLMTLVTFDISSRAFSWMLNSFSRAKGAQTHIGRLATLHLDMDSNTLSDILSFIACQVNSLKKLYIVRSSTSEDGVQRDQCFPVIMLKLEMLACSSYHPYEQRDTMDDCTSLLHFIDAPALQLLGCGHLVDCHSTQICRTLAGKWLRTSSKLRRLVAGHYEFSLSNTFEAFLSRDGIVLRNLEAVNNVFAGRQLEIKSLGAKGYRAYFEKQMDGESEDILFT